MAKTKPKVFCSIIFLTYRQGEREKTSIKCLRALLENTTFPYELIVVDNTFNNRGLSKGRNFGLSVATGDWVCIMDDDIYVYPQWLEKCISMIRRCGKDKYLATPVQQLIIKRWEKERVNGFRCNLRTGSNCMIGTRVAFNKFGLFGDFSSKRSLVYESAKSGKHYANKITRAGYSFLIPDEPLAKDLCPRKHSYLQ